MNSRMEIFILGSGSAGNSLLVRTESLSLLVDAGLSAKQTEQRLLSAGVDPRSLHGILLTHEHSDHAAALKVFCAKYSLPVYANRFTAEALQFAGLKTPIEWRYFSTGSSFELSTLKVHAFSVPHDAADPVGFVLEHAGRRFGVLTDLGYATQSVLQHTRDLDGLFIETNYDEKLLDADVKRPWSVKNRIKSRHGHLSNVAAAEVVQQIATERLRQIVIGHLSKDCNHPDLASAAISAVVNGRTRLHCATQHEVSPLLSLI